jgi:2,3-bisphosphoglycerate-dependent phosphoglycerate mutase
MASNEVYFVRHAESDSRVRDDLTRPLTEKGLKDRRLVTQFLSDKQIRHIASSPYKRALDTIQDFADQQGLHVEIADDFRERRVDSVWVDDFSGFVKQQWADFSYKLSDGESLAEVQSRYIAALEALRAKHPGENIAIASHGTALSTVIHYYDPSFGHDDFRRIVHLMPWIVCFRFSETAQVYIQHIDPFRMTS